MKPTQSHREAAATTTHSSSSRLTPLPAEGQRHCALQHHQQRHTHTHAHKHTMRTHAHTRASTHNTHTDRPHTRMRRHHMSHKHTVTHMNCTWGISHHQCTAPTTRRRTLHQQKKAAFAEVAGSAATCKAANKSRLIDSMIAGCQLSSHSHCCSPTQSPQADRRA